MILTAILVLMVLSQAATLFLFSATLNRLKRIEAKIDRPVQPPVKGSETAVQGPQMTAVVGARVDGGGII